MPQMADDLLPLVPRLRRHAFLLTGSKERGDEHVRLCLELVVAEPERLEDDDPHVQLFRAFHAVNTAIETVDDELSSLTGGYQERIRHAIGLLPLSERRALLLFVVEEFSLEQTARILDTDHDNLRRLLTEARQHLKAMVARSVLIIEDEPLIAMQLNALTADMGFTSARMVRRMTDAITVAAEQRPGLVIADLQLDSEGNGIEAALAILQQGRDVPVVFVTGYPERLCLDDGSPVFVVRKPFTKSRFKSVIGRALATYASPESAAAHRQNILTKLEQLAA